MGIRNPQILSPSPMIKTGSNPVIPIQQRDAIRVFYNNLNKFPTYPSETFIEKTQSFYPTCKLKFYVKFLIWHFKPAQYDMWHYMLWFKLYAGELPKHTSEDVWNTKESMNLMFNISLPKSSKGISINVNMARLRLYKQFVACYSQSSNEVCAHKFRYYFYYYFITKCFNFLIYLSTDRWFSIMPTDILCRNYETIQH